MIPIRLGAYLIALHARFCSPRAYRRALIGAGVCWAVAATLLYVTR